MERSWVERTGMIASDIAQRFIIKTSQASFIRTFWLTVYRMILRIVTFILKYRAGANEVYLRIRDDALSFETAFSPGVSDLDITAVFKEDATSYSKMAQSISIYQWCKFFFPILGEYEWFNESDFFEFKRHGGDFLSCDKRYLESDCIDDRELAPPNVRPSTPHAQFCRYMYMVLPILLERSKRSVERIYLARTLDRLGIDSRDQSLKTAGEVVISVSQSLGSQNVSVPKPTCIEIEEDTSWVELRYQANELFSKVCAIEEIHASAKVVMWPSFHSSNRSSIAIIFPSNAIEVQITNACSDLESLVHEFSAQQIFPNFPNKTPLIFLEEAWSAHLALFPWEHLVISHYGKWNRKPNSPKELPSSSQLLEFISLDLPNLLVEKNNLLELSSEERADAASALIQKIEIYKSSLNGDIELPAEFLETQRIKANSLEKILVEVSKHLNELLNSSKRYPKEPLRVFPQDTFPTQLEKNA